MSKVTNIELIKDFLKGNDKNLLINQVNEEIGCFYQISLREISKKFGIQIVNNSGLEVNNSQDLFVNVKIHVHNTSSSNQIANISNENNKNVIFTDYKNYKKFLKNFITVNGYEFETDLRYFLNNFYKIYDENLINFCIASPYLVYSEVSKYILNETNYVIDTAHKEENNFILDIRKDIYKIRSSRIDLRELFNKLKLEIHYKKFNFLTY